MERKLPVLATLIAAADLCRQHAFYALKITGPWVIILLIAPYLIDIVGFDNASEDRMNGLGFKESLYALLYPIAWGFIAVLWHWRVLRDDSQIGRPRIFDRRVLYYILRGIKIVIAVFAAAIAVGLPLMLIERALASTAVGLYAAGAMSIFLWALVGILFGRLSIALPAIALDVPDFGLANAFDATQHNSFRLLIVTSLPLLAATSFHWGLDLVGVDYVDLYQSSPVWSAARLFSHIWDFACGLFGLAVLSLTYAFFVERRDKSALQGS